MRFTLGVLGGVGWCGMVPGCATAVPPMAMVSPPPARARLVVENLTDYEWRVTVTATAGPEAHEARMSPRKTLEVTLAGGDYVMEQAVVAGGAGSGLARRVPARFEPGQAYCWRLVTLLSDPAGGSGTENR